MPRFDLGAWEIEYTTIKGTSRRYTYFRFREDLLLEVILPRGKKVDVERAISEKSPWLRREYERIASSRDVLGRDQVMFDGQILKVLFVEDAQESLTYDLANGTVTLHARGPSRLRELVRRWFLAESSAYVVAKVAELAPRMGVKASRVDVREIDKWGYCTRGGRLSFSWQLAALPERLKEYVVVHELAHLLHFDHSPAFKRTLAVHCPDTRQREKELGLIAPYHLKLR